MLSVPTLWVVFVINFVALGLVWTYVMRSYPSFPAARYWTAACLFAALGSAISMLRDSTPSLVPLLIAGSLLIFACWLGAMGIQRFYGRAINWMLALQCTALCAAGMTYFVLVREDMAMRILIYSIGQSVPLLMTLPLLFTKQAGRINSGARLAGIIAIGIASVHMIRSFGALTNIGGEVSFVHFNTFQASLVLVLVFLSMMWNFGFLVMAIDRLRNEVADLALMDDLTGTANRRRLLSRLDDECVRSDRTQQAFSLLMVDLDGFKEINDNYGHAAGDECLRSFARIVQSRLRSTDMLARMGGDEFCVVLPATTMREAAVVARQIVEACRETPAHCGGAPIMMTASIGVAQWHRETGLHPQRLLASGDEALYDAKKNGKNRYALENDAPLAKPLQRMAG
ncbi:MAG: GGDEF domain-containing protein [Afipia sp.]|nr:GGDEF domain-containing protein [Afipia sp.]